MSKSSQPGNGTNAESSTASSEPRAPADFNELVLESEVESHIRLRRSSSVKASARRERSRRFLESLPDEHSRRGESLLRHGLLGLLLLVSVMMGGVHFPIALTASVVAIVLAVIALRGDWKAFSREESGTVRHVGWLGLTFLLWAAWTAVQTLPLPMGLLEWFAPQTAAVVQEASQLLDEPIESASVSLAPQNGAAALWTLLGAAACFLVAFIQFRRRQAFQWIVPRLLAVGLAFLLISLVQTGFFSDTVLGLYKPEFMPTTPLRTPLLNANHAGAFFGIFAMLSLGLSFSGKDRSRRGVFFLGYAVFSLALLMSLSRGAMVAWGLSHFGLALVLAAGRLKLPRWSLSLITLGLFVALGAGMYTAEHELGDTFEQLRDAVETVPHELQRESLRLPEGLDAPELVVEESIIRAQDRSPREKVMVYRDLRPLFERFGVWGIGRGAFVDVYPMVSTTGVQGRFRHAENEYLELLLEYGLLLGIPLLLALLWAVAALFRRTDWKSSDRPLIAGVLAALLFVALQNIFDFNLRYPAIAFLSATLLGLVWGRATRYTNMRHAARDAERAVRHREEPPGARRERLAVPAMILAVLTLSMALITLPKARAGASEADVMRLELLLKEDGLTLEELQRNASSLLREHPASGQIRFMVGVGLLRLGENERAKRWLDSAMRYNPSDFRIHLLLGRWHCARASYDACALSLRRAAALHPGPSTAAMRSAARSLSEFEHLAAVLPPDPSDWEALGSALLRERRYEHAFELAELLQREYPEHIQGLDLEVDTAMALGIPEAAMAPVERMLNEFPKQARVFQRRAQLALAMGDLAGAHIALLGGLEKHPKDVGLLFARADLLVRRGLRLFVDATEWAYQCELALATLRPVALSKRSTAYGYHLLRAQFFGLRGEMRPSFNEYKVAHRINPKAAAPLRGAVLAAIELGLFDEASRLLESFSQTSSPSEVAKLARAIDERRQALIRAEP